MASLQQTGDRWNRQFVYQGKRSTLSVGKVSEAEANAKAAQVDYIFLRLKQRLITLPPGVSGGGLNDAEMTDLWDSLDLTIDEIAEFLPHIKTEAIQLFVFPMSCFGAYTEARRSEMIRVRVPARFPCIGIRRTDVDCPQEATSTVF